MKCTIPIGFSSRYYIMKLCLLHSCVISYGFQIKKKYFAIPSSFVSEKLQIIIKLFCLFHDSHSFYNFRIDKIAQNQNKEQNILPFYSRTIEPGILRILTRANILRRNYYYGFNNILLFY